MLFYIEQAVTVMGSDKHEQKNKNSGGQSTRKKHACFFFLQEKMRVYSGLASVATHLIILQLIMAWLVGSS